MERLSRSIWIFLCLRVFASSDAAEVAVLPLVSLHFLTVVLSLVSRGWLGWSEFVPPWQRGRDSSSGAVRGISLDFILPVQVSHLPCFEFAFVDPDRVRETKVRLIEALKPCISVQQVVANGNSRCNLKIVISRIFRSNAIFYLVKITPIINNLGDS